MEAVIDNGSSGWTMDMNDDGVVEKNLLSEKHRKRGYYILRDDQSKIIIPHGNMIVAAHRRRLGYDNGPSQRSKHYRRRRCGDQNEIDLKKDRGRYAVERRTHDRYHYWQQQALSTAQVCGLWVCVTSMVVGRTI